jgi:chemotaxis protein CheD
MSRRGVPAPCARPRRDLPTVHTLHPGDVCVAERGERLETLLGSCVAVVMTDPRRTIGAMCHVVHSREPVAAAVETSAWGEMALRTMYGGLLARGIVPALCQAWVYGGGNMFPSLFEQGHVGADNVDWALAALARDSVRVLSHDTGGLVYRKLAWTVGDGPPEVAAVQV